MLAAMLKCGLVNRGMCFLLALLGVFQGAEAATVGAFSNPLISNGADPWVIFKDGSYYYTQTTGGQVTVRKSPTITGLATAISTTVFVPPSPNSSEVWAPELHFLNGKWYIYYASDDGNNNNHRIYAAEAATTNAQGAYTFKGKVFDAANDFWAIDATVFQATNGALYMIWSGWPGTANVVQNIYIAPMSNPWTISGPRVLLSTPTLNWEISPNPGAPLINEGPEVLTRNGKVFIIYSANKSWLDHYCLGLLINTNGDLLNANAWTKYSQPAFSGIVDETGSVYSPGHCSFTRNAAQTEDWIVYHAAKASGAGFNRDVRAQPFGWGTDDLPFFGRPVVTNLPVIFPAGEGPSNPFSVNPNITNGFTQLEMYSAIPGTQVAALTNHVKFPQHPDVTRFIGQLEVPPGNGNDYGGRISGFLVPPATGAYRFYVSSSQESQFFLSTDEQRTNKVLICREPIGNSYRTWTGTQNRPAQENISANISLVAGKSYYLEALLKAGINGTNDHFGVAWQTPGGAVPANGSVPIPGAVLAIPFDSTVTTAPVLAAQPTNESRYLGMTAAFSVQAASGVPPWYQWQKQVASNDWQNIVGGYGSVFTLTPVGAGDASSYRAVVRNQAGLATSASANLQVFSAPTLVGSIGAGSAMQVSFPAHPGFTFDLQASTNFFDWEIVATTNGANGTIQLIDPQAPAFDTRSYRVSIH